MDRAMPWHRFSRTERKNKTLLITKEGRHRMAARKWDGVKLFLQHNCAEA